MLRLPHKTGFVLLEPNESLVFRSKSELVEHLETVFGELKHQGVSTEELEEWTKRRKAFEIDMRSDEWVAKELSWNKLWKLLAVRIVKNRKTQL
jgi:hypothetical protein